jgi:hypothetical protein
LRAADSLTSCATRAQGPEAAGTMMQAHAKEAAMAKGKDKGGREAKKPKADKKAPAQAPAPPRPMPVATRQGPKTPKPG